MSLVFLPGRRRGRAKLACVFLVCLALQSPQLAVAEPVAASVPTSSFASLLQVVFGLGLVLAAIAGTAWLLRRIGPGRVAASGSLRVVGGVAVGPKERVILVDIGETRLVLGVAPGHISTLHQMPRPDEDSPIKGQEEVAGAFYHRFKDILNKRGGA